MHFDGTRNMTYLSQASVVIWMRVCSQGYIKWRQFCGLPIATTFEQLQDIVDANVRAKFKSIYRYVAYSVIVPAVP